MKYFLAILVVLGAIGIGLAIVTTWNHANESAERACVLSLREPLASSLNASGLVAGNSTENWKVLEGENALALIRESAPKAADCGSAAHTRKGEDLWGNRLHVFFALCPTSR